LGVRRKQKDNSVIRLEAGLGQLAAAGEATDILAKELEVQNADIAEKKTDVEAIIETVNIQTAEVNEQASVAKKTEEELSVAAVEINRIAKDAAEAVARAEPALQAAKKALEKVDKKDIGEIKALANPPEAIKLTCCVCYHLLVNSKDDGWD
jgi:dynein heavy chain